MLHCQIQHMSKPEESSMSKQSRPNGTEVISIVEINGKKAASTSGAIAILQEFTGYKYSRDSIYRMYLDGKIEGVRTDVANYYYIDSLERAGESLKALVPPPGKNRRGRRKKGEQIIYSKETKEQARQLRQNGMSYGAIAKKLDVSSQLIQYWLKPVS
jgi:hypothetical protein